MLKKNVLFLKAKKEFYDYFINASLKILTLCVNYSFIDYSTPDLEAKVVFLSIETTNLLTLLSSNKIFQVFVGIEEGTKLRCKLNLQLICIKKVLIGHQI